MNRRNILKLVHFGSTAWFVLCVGCILVLTLRQAGKSWWVIVSLSGYSGLIAFLLISMYLFAIFRGVARSQKVETEHPLTSTEYYMVFYAITPFLGGIAGALGMIGENRTSQSLLGIAMGALGATFLVWIIVDPAIGLFEMLLPGSRKHRLERLARLRVLRQKRQQEQERLLAEISAQEQRDKRQWQQVLQGDAEKLAQLLANGKISDEKTESEAVDIGANAWQIGGLNCMRQLRNMAVEICGKKHQDSMIIDYVSTWWDGIGSWRSPSLG